MAKFIKTVRISSIAPIEITMRQFQIGQWFLVTETGQRGQFLGNTATGPVIHWQKEGRKFCKTFAEGNYWLRGFAKEAKPYHSFAKGE